jgi:D-alanine-D-alanine ligase
VTRVDDAAMLPAALMTCFGYHDEALVERWVAGTEVAVAVIDTGTGPTALPAVEIVPDSGFYDYAARYTAGATEFFSPARLSDTAAEAAAQAALTAHRVLGLRDLSRTDIIVDSDGRPFVLETNVAPGMTPTSTFPMALREAGFEFGIFLRDVAMNAATRAAIR